MFKKTAVAKALVLGFGLGAALGVVQAQEQLERVEITGSAIKRTNAEGPSPVEVVTRKQIERTGATSVNELLRSIPSIDIFDQGELASNSPAGSGTANVRLRGLSSSETLVLLNGRRLPVNAIYDSSRAGAAFDINSLPIGAIEQVQILKDGGSAIYGADAIGGVVNFITKSDYQGIEANLSTGQTSRSDGKETRFGVSAGFGDLNKDRFNILVGLDYLKRDPIYRKDRDISSSVDFRRFGGGDYRSSFSPYGNIYDPATGNWAGPYAACPAENLGTGNICRYDFNKSLLTAYNGADRLSAMAIASYQINPDTRAFAEVTYSTSKDHFEAHPVPDYFVVPITSESQRPYEIPADWGLGSDKLYIAGRFMQGGPRITDRKSDFVNAAAGLEGSFGTYDWKVNVSRGESKVVNTDQNYYDATKWGPATESGRLNPTVNTNDPAFVDSLKVSPVRVGKSVLTTFNGLLSGDVTKLPAGMMKFAVGVNLNRETLSDIPDKLTQAGKVIGAIQQAPVDASRTYKAVFGELAIPVLKSLEAQAALRYDKYPNASATSPKLGLKWTATPTLALRGSYSGSFRAPVLKQLYGAQEEGASNLQYVEDCKAVGLATRIVDGKEICDASIFKVGGSNANLQPEKGKTWNLGAVFELSKNFNASVDWWKINKTNDISTPTVSTAISQGFWTKEGPRVRVFTNLQNFAQRETSGVDVDARWRINGTALGNVSVRNLLTYYSTIKTRTADDSPWAEYVGTYAAPRFRNGLNVSVENGPWIYGVTWKTVGGFWDTDKAFPIAPKTGYVGTFEEADALVQYTGFKNLELSLGVKNLFDRMPPLSLTNASTNTYTQMGFAEIYTNRGRYIYVSGKYTFR